MTDPVALFMLQSVPAESKTYGCMSLRTDLCDEVLQRHHVAYNDVPTSTETWDDVVDYATDNPAFLVHSKAPIICKHCAKPFKRGKFEHWFTYYKNRWTNTKTGVTGPDPHQVASPGACWFANYLIERDEVHNSGYLSPNYLTDWYGIRAPFYIMCPDGKPWCPDARATNGPGWKVTGDWDRPDPKITAMPSIDTGTYHAFLTDGVFGADPNCKGPQN